MFLGGGVRLRRYYLVTNEILEFDGYAGIDTGGAFGEGIVELAFGNVLCRFYEVDLTEISERDFNVIEDELSRSVTFRVDELYRKISNGSYVL